MPLINWSLAEIFKDAAQKPDDVYTKLHLENYLITGIAAIYTATPIILGV